MKRLVIPCVVGLACAGLVLPASAGTGDGYTPATILDVVGDAAPVTGVDGTLVVGSRRVPAYGYQWRAFVADAADPAGSTRLLGTFLGTGPTAGSSNAIGVGGTFVVGTAAARSGERPFVYDVAHPDRGLRDLGGLGGASTQPHAIDGSLVVGGSQTPSGTEHAFVEDLSAATPVMRDLGVLPGAPSSVATAIDGSVVVGDSGYHSFAYDLADPATGMRDLGAGDALAVSGHVVVGESNGHAFAYDLNGSSGMIDLGTLGGPWSRASAISGSLIVGVADTAFWGPNYPSCRGTGRYVTHAFVYDLANPSAGMRDLGSLGGPGAASSAEAISGRLVGGWSETSPTCSSYVRRAFAYDLDNPGAGMVDLGTYGGPDAAVARIDGSLIAGTVTSVFGTVSPAFWRMLPGRVDLRAAFAQLPRLLQPYRAYTFHLRVTNASGADATGTTVLLDRPRNGVFVSPAPNASGAATAAVGTVRAGATVDVPITIRTGGQIGPSTLFTTAHVRSTLGDPAPADNVATLAVRIDSPVLTISPQSATVPYGRVVRISTQLYNAAGGMANRPVTLYRRTITLPKSYPYSWVVCGGCVASSAWTRVATVTTAAHGLASVADRPTVSVQYLWRFSGDNRTALPAVSKLSSVQIAPVIRAQLAATTIRHGQHTTLSGSVVPGVASKVGLQRLIGGSWRTIAAMSLSSTGTYRFTVGSSIVGSYTYRVYRPADGRYHAAASVPVTLRVV